MGATIVTFSEGASIRTIVFVILLPRNVSGGKRLRVLCYKLIEARCD